MLLAILAAQVGEWAVMTDELLYERLAISVSESRSPIPTLRGDWVGVYAQLYPLLLAPVFALFSMPAAVVAAHAWNGVVMASAAIPAYLLARELALPRWMRYTAAAFTVAVPWVVIAGFLMTEVAAYPAFLWAILAGYRAIAHPSDRRQLLAVFAVLAAALARPQLALLGATFLAAALFHDLRFGRGRAAVVRHRVFIGAAVVAVLAAFVSAGGVFGSYAPALLEGSLFSRDALRSATVHLDVVAVAIGLAVFFVGLGWAIEAAVRGPDGSKHAFASLTATTVGFLAIEVGSVVTRFGVGLDVKDRYLFYLAPILFLAAAAAVTDPRPRVAGLLAVSAFFILTVGWESFEPVFGVNIDSPASSTHEALTRRANEFGITASTLVILVGSVIVVALYFGLRTAKRHALAIIVLGGSLAFGVAQTAYTFDRLFKSPGPGVRPVTGSPPETLAWIDRAGADGVAMLPYSLGQDWYPSAGAWWDVEFWNKSVTSAYMIGGTFTYTPESFPRQHLSIDLTTGVIDNEAPDYVARTVLDARFRPVGRQRAAQTIYELVEVESPFRAAWVSLGLDADGWTRPGRPAAVRVFWPTGLTRVLVTLSAPNVELPRRFVLGAANAGALRSTESIAASVVVCVREGTFVDVPLQVRGRTVVRDIAPDPPYSEKFRPVGLRLSRISTERIGSCGN